MNTRKKAGSTATEVIADLTKKLNTVNADMEYIYSALSAKFQILMSLLSSLPE